MIEQTVIAWDGSDAARRASTWAASRAAATSDALRVMQVVDRSSADDGESLKRAVASTEDEASRLRVLHPELLVRADVVIGDRYAELRGLSDDTRLVVLGTDEHGSPTRSSGWSLGSRLAAASSGPVAVIPELAEAGRHGVVVGVDGTTDHAALSFAAREAIARREPLHLVHAWHRPTTTGVHALNPTLVDWIRETHSETLARTTASLVEAFPEVSVQQHLTESHPAGALHAFAASASAIVVGTRGYGPIRRFMLGSTSHTLLLYIDAPTIVVPSAPQGPSGATDPLLA
ncbi:universal stress protein [Plantibacter sp. ME-Dv--P-122b]|uniref:universal stress protein n=1 Tax=Plantibacter sp. ME-Dv--P-122b TaxID=3040300 RepID=UPI00254F81F4|nr:universal stress protein [Plantibacter sp. ME-Dv--P-122b]